MQSFKFFIFSTFIITLSFSQNNNSNISQGLSVSLSDNLDAINLNPAGLGVDRGRQWAFNIQQASKLDDNNSNVYILSYTNRTDFGLTIEHTYDEINKYSWSLGYGFKLNKNLYSGFQFDKNSNYSVGMLYRPYNFLSTGTTLFTDNDDTYRYIRYGFAIKPFSFKNKSNINKNTFQGYSNLAIGFDRITSFDDAWKEEETEDYFFMNFDIVPGFNIGLSKYSGNSYALNMSLNIGNTGIQYSSYASDNFHSTSTSNGIGFFEYSQTKDSDLNFINKSKTNYVWITLDGYFIEEKPYKNPFNFDINISLFGGNNYPDAIQLKSFIDQINELAYNETIEGMVVKLEDVYAGFSKRKEIHDALVNFKNQGKKIIVYSEEGISNSNYYLISMADEIYVSELSGVELRGLNLEMTFFRGLLDTLYIVPEVIRVSPYKSAADPLLNEEMSPEVKENYGQLADDLYEIMVTDIANARNWTTGDVTSRIDDGPYYNSSDAIDIGLINGTFYPDDFREYINSMDINLISWDDFTPTEYYINDWIPDETPKIAIIYAVGGIISGKSNPGPYGSSIMGDQTIKEAIKEAREDESIKAIILRIDSGGGSALASDMIWKEVSNTTDPDSENHKPFIVSMSDVAASGGYYIACQADKIIADPSTVTGSIGVIWARLNFTKLLNKIGITTDGIKRGENADFGSPSHLFTEEEKERFLDELNGTYNIFKEKVISGRDTLNDMDELDDIALGRIWTGNSAKELGLIDEIGGIHYAIDSAKESANIISSADVQIVEYPENKPFSFFNLFSEEDEFSILELTEIFPEDLAKQLEVLNLIPVLMNDEIQFLIPYTIEIN